MKLRLITTQGSQFDFDPPDNFNFDHFVSSLKLNQHWYMPPNIFVPYHAISSVVMLDPNKAVDFSGGMVKQ